MFKSNLLVNIVFYWLNTDFVIAILNLISSVYLT